jgi:hydroxylaminobenzene mutase
MSGESMISDDRQARRLLAAGAILFLVGLLSGLAVPVVTNPRMGLAAHLEGVMNGTFLIAVGAVWTRLVLSTRQRTAAAGLLLYGTYANWLFITLAALLGTSAATPIAGAGHAGAPWQEDLVTAGLVTVAIAMIVATALLALGFVRRAS